MKQYMISEADHLALPWRVHELLADFDLEDVWRFPLLLRPENSLADFRREMTAAVDHIPRFGAAALLFRIRLLIGRLFGWDRPVAPGRARPLRARYVASRPDDRAAGDSDVEAAPGATSFSPVYIYEDEYLGEIENKTVLAALHLGRVPVPGGNYAVHLAVYSQPKGRFGRLYMRLIEPFRLWVVYPAIMRLAARRWEQFMASVAPPE